MNNQTALLIFFLVQTVTSLEKFITDHFVDSFVFISSDFDNLDERLTFILRLNSPKVFKNPKSVTDLEFFENYIIAEPNSTESASFLYTPLNTINTRGRFLVILPDATDDETKSILETLWSFYVYNVVAYVNWTTFVTWYPYRNCGSLTTVMMNVSQPYENKIPRYLQGCPINVTWDHIALSMKEPSDKTDPGFTVRVLDAVAKILNAKIDYLDDNIKFGSPTMEIMELLAKDVKNRYIDLVVWFAPGLMTISPDLECSAPYFYISCFFVLPPRHKITGSTETLVIFSTTVWVLIATFGFFMTVTLRSLFQITFDESLFQVIRLVLQGTVQKRPKTNTKRVIFVVFVFYVINLNWIYISQLSGVLSQPSYEPKILTMRDLARSDKKLKFSHLWDPYFLDGGVMENLIKQRVKAVDGVTYEEELEDFVQNLDHGFINTDVRQAYFKNPEKLTTTSKDQIATLVAYFLVRKGFPLLDKLNDGFLRLWESGLVHYWIEESEVSVNKTLVPDCEDVEGRLGLDRILSAFIIFGSGLATATVVFFLELTYARVRSKKNGENLRIDDI